MFENASIDLSLFYQCLTSHHPRSLCSYSRETPRRFKQEVLSPYIVGNAIDVEQLNRLLTNIGHSNDCLSVKEQNQLLQEVGCAGRSIPVGTLAALIE